MEYEILTDIGRKRTVNEDRAAVYKGQEGVILAIIADGMGGHRGGDFASATAVELMGERFMSLQEETDSQQFSWENWLGETIAYVNSYLYDYAQKNEEYKGMGTTLEAVLILEDKCLVYHIGDSRVYSITDDGIRQVTNDHSYVNVLLESGEITEEEAAVHPKRNWIMRAIGSEQSIEFDLYSLPVQEIQYLMLCTDGLSNKLNEETMFDIVNSADSLQDKAENLISLANEKGGEDNISVVLLDLSGMEVT